MSEEQPNDDLDHDGRFTSLTDSLGSAFESQADRFEPSNNAYASLAEAVNAHDPSVRSTRTIGWFRPALAAAAAVVAVGGGATLLANQQPQSVNTGPAAEQDVAVAEAEAVEDEDVPCEPVFASDVEDASCEREAIPNSDGPESESDDDRDVTVEENQEEAVEEADLTELSDDAGWPGHCLLYTSPSPRDATLSRMPSSA